jgi:muramoyltetrapeptide carboxypeptidase
VTADTGEWIKPRRVRPGDRIALLAPASAFQRADFDAGVSELRKLGFDPVYDDRVFERKRFVAGDAERRAAALMEAWDDTSIAAIVAVRGGYGSAQLLPLLDPARMIAARKVFVGYSDITALLSFHLQHRLICFHGPMIERRLGRAEEGYHASSFWPVICETAPIGELVPTGLVTLRKGEASGLLVGGTLTQLAASLGTPWAFTPPAGSLLFIEDVAERPYRIDRMLTQLNQSGVLQRAGGIIFGEFPSCDEPTGEHRIQDVLAEFMRDFPGPVMFGFPSGHTNGPTWTLPFGVRARMFTGSRSGVIIEEAAVV